MTDYKNSTQAKRYYWLKLKNDFFDQKEIRLLRKIAGGDTYTIIYLKMLLASLQDNGKLYFESIGDNFSEEIALLIDEDIENVQVTLNYLEKKGLIEVIESDEYFLNRVPEMVGSESYSAERMRRLRKKELSQRDANPSQNNSNVIPCDEEKRAEKKAEKKEKSESIEQRKKPSNDADAIKLAELINLFYDCFNIQASKEIKTEISRLLVTYGYDFVQEAISKACYRETAIKYPISYITKMLESWHSKGYESIEDIYEEQEEFNEYYDEAGDISF